MTAAETAAMLDRLEVMHREAIWSRRSMEYIRVSQPEVAALCNMLLEETITILLLARRGLLAEEMVGLLKCCDTSATPERVAPEDAAVEALCEKFGYGAVMTAASRMWRRREPVGAFIAGPYAGPVRDLMARWDALVAEQKG